MSGVVAAQLEELRERFGGSHVRQLPSGSALVTAPDVRLPQGWSKNSTTIRFLIPQGYPFASLDCFWADADLRLAAGAMPQSAAINPIPETTEQGLWFSWHLVGTWDANRESLSTWMNVVGQRMRQIR
jgi:hypothetical protein